MNLALALSSRIAIRSSFVRIHAIALLIVAFAASVAPASDAWPQFRGPTGDGHSDAKGLPLTWSETPAKNLKWRTAVPGEGWSSPVVQGTQVWMTTAVNKGKSLRAICIDRDNGQIVYDIELFTPSDPGKIHQLNSYASPTPVIEDGRVYCHFGNFGTAAIDTKTGKPAWKTTEFNGVIYTVGPGSSPILFEDKLIVHCDGINARFLLALNKDTGKIAWKTPRSNVIKKTEQQEKSFCTPVLVEVNGKKQLVSIHADAVSGYDPATGRELWQLKYEGYSNVSLPVIGHGQVYMSTGYDNAQFWAFKLGGSGALPAKNVTWKVTRGIGKRVSPMLVGDELYLMNDEGVALCLDAKTGEQHWQQRVGGQYCASPVYVDGRIYFFDMEGTATVIAPGKEYKELAKNKLGDGFMGSPAIAGKAFFLRSKTAVYRVEE